VTGAARPYSWVTPDVLPLEAGSEAVAKVGFRMPQAPLPAAGPLPFEVAVQIAGATAPAVTASGVVELQPFSALSATLSSPDEASPGRHVFTLGNRGNAPMPTQLRVEADAGVEARIEPASVVAVPGSSVTATVDVTPKRPFLGAARTSTFRVTAEPEVGAAARCEGHLSVQPVVPRRTLAVAALLAAVGLVAGLVVAVSGGKEDGEPATDEVAAGAGSRPLDACPARGHTDEYGVRGLQEREIANLPDTYTFLRIKSDGCSPVRFNPCEPVHYVQNVGAAPPDVAFDVREAFRKLSRATGIAFVDDGMTDETVRSGPYVPERYGHRWAPILILFDRFAVEQTSGRQQILGNANPMRVDDVTVSARLRFNVDAYNDEFTREPINTGFGPPSGSGTGPIGRENVTWGRIILHELAHLAGLGHTRELASLMYPDAADQTGRPADFNRNDLEGLRYLGREAGCLPSPPLPTG
jgi:hypothetical protein